MKRFLQYSLLVALLASIAVACTSHDELVEPAPQPLVEQNADGSYCTTFYIPDVWELGNQVQKDDFLYAKLELYPMAQRLSPYHYNGIVTVIGKMLAVSFLIAAPGESEDLPDGSYLMHSYNQLGKSLGRELVATFKNRKLESVQLVPNYDSVLELNADGDAYVIKDEYDFMDMCDLLAEDPSYGRNKSFVQRGDLYLSSNMGSTTIDEGWYCCNFAGHYNGRGHSIHGFAYNGKKEDSTSRDVGLFRVLYNGAVIENLQLSTSGILGVNHSAGILAGSIASGAVVTISECRLEGTISDSMYAIGALAGKVEKGADVTVNNVELGVNILGDSDSQFVGGLFGLVEECKIAISGVEIYLDNLRIEGGPYVGGLIGYASRVDLSVDWVDMVRSTTKDMKVLSGTKRVGGLIGYAEMNRDFHIKNTTVAFPISGSEDGVGGMIGDWYVTDMSEETISACFENVYISSNLQGRWDVGGFIGSISSFYSGARLEFRGSCYFGSIQNNLTEVSGEYNVGSLVGGIHDRVSFDFEDSDVQSACTVTATKEKAGGLIGYAKEITLKLPYPITTSTSVVTAPAYVGGVVGHLERGMIMGNTPIYVFLNKGYKVVPAFSTVAESGPDVTIKVNASSATGVGGVVGLMSDDSAISNISTNSEVTGCNRVGGIVGEAVGCNWIEGAYTGPTGFTRGTGIEIGGIVGRVESNVEVYNCINYSRIEDGESGSEIGGIAGYACYSNSSMPHIYDCANVGSILGRNVVGGIVGLARVNLGSYHNVIMIERSVNFGAISGNTTSSYNGATKAIGGILGISDKPAMVVAHCANFGSIRADGGFYGAGGIVGKIGVNPAAAWEEYNFKIYQCANHGNLSGTAGGCNWGGIVGYMEEGTSTSGDHSFVGGCYNMGDITASISGDNGLGGIAGYLDSYAELWRNVNFKMLTSYSGGNTGRIWGSSKSSVHTTEHNYYLDESDGNHYAFKESEMSDPSIFTNLKINETDSYWVMSDGDPHPQLRNCPFQNATLESE